jgi:hypothetical protein
MAQVGLGGVSTSANGETFQIQRPASPPAASLFQSSLFLRLVKGEPTTSAPPRYGLSGPFALRWCGFSFCLDWRAISLPRVISLRHERASASMSVRRGIHD